MEHYNFIVTAEEELRVDKFLSMKFDDISRSFLQKLIKDNCVMVNDKLIKSNFVLKENDNVKIDIPDAVQPDIIAEEIPLDILYEDEDLLIVNKPKGMVVHPAAGHYSGTLVNAVMFYCKDSLSGINGVMRPGIVHRIDKNTTGSIVICKNDNSHQFVADLLKEHKITRRYHAIVKGHLEDDCGTIEGNIARHSIDRKKMCVSETSGKPAVTHYKVLERFSNHTYVECELETGRTHQIRVHFASLRHPILGDDVYGDHSSKFKLDGQCLHAKTIGFEHPRTHEYLEVDAPLPEYFAKLLKKL